MNGRLGKTLFVGKQFFLYEREGERCVAPAVLENTVNAVEQEEDAVHLRHSKLDLTRAKRLNGNRVRA